MDTPPEILIVDDELSLRTWLRRSLMLDGYAVLEADNGVAALHVWQQREPQLVILDITMPELDGLQVLERVRQTANTPIIMLTKKSGEDDKVRAFELGADDYLTKHFSHRELMGRVKAVLRRLRPTAVAGPAAGPAALVIGELRLDLATHQVRVGERPVKLSRTEFNLLLELARTPGQILSDRQLLARVWGPEYRDGDPDLLRVLIYRLRQKLETNADQPRLILRQHAVGYWLAAARPEAEP
jgi:DNA-binding response OmpR family regulator